MIADEAQPWRLRKHADYQRVYKASRKQSSTTITFFCAKRLIELVPERARVGITAGKVLGNAVERNRIKRRMRAAIRASVHLLPPEVDVILHPRRSVLEAEFTQIKTEVEQIFRRVEKSASSTVRSA
jgi:ribonuclease P protein component